MATGRDLLKKLQEIPEEDLDRDVLVEGCDCVRRWDGEFNKDWYGSLMLTSLS